MDQNFQRGLRGYLRQQFIEVLEWPHPVVGQAWYEPTAVGSRMDLVDRSLREFGQNGRGWSGSENAETFGIGYYAAEIGRSLRWSPSSFPHGVKTRFDELCDKNEKGSAGLVIRFHEAWFQTGRDAVALASEVMQECVVQRNAEGQPNSDGLADVFKVRILHFHENAAERAQYAPRSRYVAPYTIMGPGRANSDPGQIRIRAEREKRTETYDIIRDSKGDYRVETYNLGNGRMGFLPDLNGMGRDARPHVGCYHVSRESCLRMAFSDSVGYAALLLRSEPSNDQRVEALVAQERNFLAGEKRPALTAP